MPNENDLALNLNTIAGITQTQHDANTPAEQGPAPSVLPPEPDIQPIQPGEHLSAEQLETLMGDTEASNAHDPES